MTSPLDVRIGHSSRRWNRSIGPRLPSRRQPGRFELLELETLAQQVFRQRVPARRGEPAAEVSAAAGVEVALGQVVAGGRGLGGLQCRRRRTPGRPRWRRSAARAAAVALHVGGRRPGVGDGVAEPVGELLDGLDEADVLDLLQEAIDVAALAAAEAVEMPVVGPDVEGRRLLVVERAQALERVAPARRSVT